MTQTEHPRIAVADHFAGFMYSKLSAAYNGCAFITGMRGDVDGLGLGLAEIFGMNAAERPHLSLSQQGLLSAKMKLGNAGQIEALDIIIGDMNVLQTFFRISGPSVLNVSLPLEDADELSRHDIHGDGAENSQPFEHIIRCYTEPTTRFYHNEDIMFDPETGHCTASPGVSSFTFPRGTFVKMATRHQGADIPPVFHKKDVGPSGSVSMVLSFAKIQMD
jgi:hypothetical protein